MSTKYFILPSRYTPDSVKLEKEARNMGWETQRLKSWSKLESLRGENIIIYQEFALAHVVANAAGISLITAPDTWLEKLPEIYRKRKIFLGNLSSLRKHKFPLFIKDASEKRFFASVYNSYKNVKRNKNISRDLTLLISEPVIWELELRFFILERQIATFSPYFQYGQLAQKNNEWYATEDELLEAQQFMQQMLKDKNIDIPPAIVIDIGKINGRGWGVVETNPVWAVGLYGCDPKKILPVLERACIPIHKIKNKDAK